MSKTVFSLATLSALFGGQNGIFGAPGCLSVLEAGLAAGLSAWTSESPEEFKRNFTALMSSMYLTNLTLTAMHGILKSEIGKKVLAAGKEALTKTFDQIGEQAKRFNRRLGKVFGVEPLPCEGRYLFEGEKDLTKAKKSKSIKKAAGSKNASSGGELYIPPISKDIPESVYKEAVEYWKNLAGKKDMFDELIINSLKYQKIRCPKHSLYRLANQNVSGTIEALRKDVFAEARRKGIFDAEVIERYIEGLIEKMRGISLPEVIHTIDTAKNITPDKKILGRFHYVDANLDITLEHADQMTTLITAIRKNNP